MTRIAPSILSADFLRLGEEIHAIEQAGADLVHIDIMDGHFVPNITIGHSVVGALRKITKLPLDVHLMIEEPERYLDSFISAGSDVLTVHYEASVHLHRTISAIREKGVKAGVSVNPATPPALLESILPDVDMVLVMSVNPGFGGQDFIPSSLAKIRTVKEMVKGYGLKTMIEVDGGVKPENAAEIAAAGADILVIGSAFFSSGDYPAMMKRLNGILGNS